MAYTCTSCGVFGQSHVTIASATADSRKAIEKRVAESCAARVVLGGAVKHLGSGQGFRVKGIGWSSVSGRVAGADGTWQALTQPPIQSPDVDCDGLSLPSVSVAVRQHWRRHAPPFSGARLDSREAVLVRLGHLTHATGVLPHDTVTFLNPSIHPNDPPIPPTYQPHTLRTRTCVT